MHFFQQNCLPNIGSITSAGYCQYQGFVFYFFLLYLLFPISISCHLFFYLVASVCLIHLSSALVVAVPVIYRYYCIVNFVSFCYFINRFLPLKSLFVAKQGPVLFVFFIFPVLNVPKHLNYLSCFTMFDISLPLLFCFIFIYFWSIFI